MTIASWCRLVALLAPYFLSLAARSQARRADYVDDPRAWTAGTAAPTSRT